MHNGAPWPPDSRWLGDARPSIIIKLVILSLVFPSQDLWVAAWSHRCPAYPQPPYVVQSSSPTSHSVPHNLCAPEDGAV